MGVTVSCPRGVKSELYYAIREGDVRLVKALLNQNPQLVNTASLSHRRLSPLHYAASHGQTDVLTLLLERKAEMNALNCYKQTPLMLACKNGQLLCIEQLIDWGANVLTFDSPNRRTCLHYAVNSGDLGCLERILETGQLSGVAETWGFTRFVNVRDDKGATPLHLAARLSHAPLVRCLLHNGALVCATTTSFVTNNYSGSPRGGSTPLHSAARGGSTDCVSELLAWGADRCQRDAQGCTPYFIALKYQNTACAALLNPRIDEPLVWPSPWKFMSDLEPEAKTLLEKALAEANDVRERKIRGETMKISEAMSTIEEEEVCCICFESICTIEIQECGHQMCAACTLALCSHNKPNPAVPHSPSPPCPFCRCSILKLKLVHPKPPQHWQDAESSSSRGAAVAGKEGSLRHLLCLSSARASGRVADLERAAAEDEGGKVVGR